MFAANTDAVVRYLANDDTAQATETRRLFAHHDVFVSLIVLLEIEWVQHCH